MGEYVFSYEMPADLANEIAASLDHNGNTVLSNHIRNCEIDYEDLGYAYYAGLCGDTWNKKALNLTIYGNKEDIDFLSSNKKLLRDMIQMVLRPNVSGFLIKEVFFIVHEKKTSVDLPLLPEESFDVLSKDIKDAISKNEPALVLDRLHTFTMKFLRKVCAHHRLKISDNGEYYPLHS